MDRGSLALRVLAALSAVVMVLQSAYASPPAPWPYLQVYPAVNKSDSRTPLYFALVLSFGEEYRSIGALPGVQIALDYINSNPDILPGHTLHYTLTDSQVYNYYRNYSYLNDSFSPRENILPEDVLCF